MFFVGIARKTDAVETMRQNRKGVAVEIKGAKLSNDKTVPVDTSNICSSNFARKRKGKKATFPEGNFK